jgi:acetyl esterase/lipase
MAAMITTLTHMLLRRTVRRWFEQEPSPKTMRTKLDGFIGGIDKMSRAYRATPAGEAGGAALHLVAPVKPLAEDAPLVLYFHGGGYIVGGLASHGAFCARVARAAGGRVLFADYRLAPEHPFPAAFEDGLAAYHHAASAARGKLFIAGDSAGGGLALAVGHAALAAGLRAPDGLILISPWTDLTLSGASMIGNAATDSMLSMKILTRMRGYYLGLVEPGDRRASPLFDPSNKLPPVLILFSESEVLEGDATRLAQKLLAGGTAVKARGWKGKPHVFPLFKTLPGAGAALKEIANFVKST